MAKSRIVLNKWTLGGDGEEHQGVFRSSTDRGRIFLYYILNTILPRPPLPNHFLSVQFLFCSFCISRPPRQFRSWTTIRHSSFYVGRLVLSVYRTMRWCDTGGGGGGTIIIIILTRRRRRRKGWLLCVFVSDKRNGGWKCELKESQAGWMAVVMDEQEVRRGKWRGRKRRRSNERTWGLLQ